MSDNLTVFGTDYTGVTGIKAKGTGNGLLTYIRPVGTKSISANGTGIDVTNYASVDVAVPSQDNTFVVTISYNSTTEMWEPDCTVYELQDAYAAGKDIAFVGPSAQPVSWICDDDYAFVYFIFIENPPTLRCYIFTRQGVEHVWDEQYIVPLFDSPSRTYTPTTQQQTDTITYDPVDYTGIQQVNITVNAMPSGSVSASASKGTVSNHSVSVTPTATVGTAGYLAAGNTNGTAVTVSASELVSGSETKTANGTYDVTNLAQLVVDVQGGGSSSMLVDTVEVTSGTSSSLVFSGLKGEPVIFDVIIDEVVSPSAQQTVVALSFDGTTVHGQTITNTSNAQVSYNTSFTKSYSNGTLTITSNGPAFGVYPYFLTYAYGGSASDTDTKDVQVGSGATSITFSGLEDEPICWSCIFKSNFGTSSGYQRVIFVNNDGGSTIGLAMDSSAHPSNSYWTASYSNGSLTITSQGTNAGGYFHQPGYYQLTCAYSGGSGNYQSKTVTPTTSSQEITADTGYDALKKVTVNPIPSQYIVPSGNINITSNTASGQSLDISQYETATVNVQSSGSSKNVQTAQSTTRVANTAYTKTASLTCSTSGKYDVYWDCFRSSTSGTNGSQLYIGGNAYGTANTTFANSIHVQSNHLTNVQINANQEVAVYVRSRATNYYAYCGQLTIVQSS